MNYNVLIMGKGGREHALAKKIQESSLLNQLWVCPGNPGMELQGFTCVKDDSTEAVLTFCQKQNVQIVILGPENYILSDLKTTLEKNGIYCFAPSSEAALLESSKAFSKKILQGAEIPTAKAQTVKTVTEGNDVLKSHDFERNGIVLKADGLAQGKGVWVCQSYDEAKEALKQLSHDYGFTVLIEEMLLGTELSVFAVCKGKDFRILGTACDYKRITEDPFSANTGGMGSYSPCDFLTADDEKKIERIYSNVLTELAAQGFSYEGFLFAGLMKTREDLFVLEFNVRMGDPETQSLLPRVNEDLLEMIAKARDHELESGWSQNSSQYSVHIVATSKGYPFKDMLLGQKIHLPTTTGNIIFAGVQGQNQDLKNSGGRVLGITAMGASKAEARAKAYSQISDVFFEGMYYRKDIGT